MNLIVRKFAKAYGKKLGAHTPAAIYDFLSNSREKKGVFALSTPSVIPPPSWSNANYQNKNKPFKMHEDETYQNNHTRDEIGLCK